DSPNKRAYVGYGHGLNGDREKALKVVDELKVMAAEKSAYVDPANFAIIYLGIGDKDAACAEFEKAVAERSSTLIMLKVDPMFDSLRSHPRFVELMKKMRFPD